MTHKAQNLIVRDQNVPKGKITNSKIIVIKFNHMKMMIPIMIVKEAEAGQKAPKIKKL